MQPIQRRAIYLIVLVGALAWIFVSADRAGTSTAGAIPAPPTGLPSTRFYTQDTRRRNLRALRATGTSRTGQPVGNLVPTLPRGNARHPKTL